jgi:hypothetical protein
VGTVVVEDPYRLRRALGHSVETFAYATTVLLFYALPGSLLLDRWRETRPSIGAKSAVLAVLSWLIVAGIACAQVGFSLSLFLNLSLLVGLPMFCGVFAMLKTMSSNKSLERTRER